MPLRSDIFKSNEIFLPFSRPSERTGGFSCAAHALFTSLEWIPDVNRFRIRGWAARCVRNALPIPSCLRPCSCPPQPPRGVSRLSLTRTLPRSSPTVLHSLDAMGIQRVRLSCISVGASRQEPWADFCLFAASLSGELWQPCRSSFSPARHTANCCPGMVRPNPTSWPGATIPVQHQQKIAHVSFLTAHPSRRLRIATNTLSSPRCFGLDPRPHQQKHPSP